MKFKSVSSWIAIAVAAAALGWFGAMHVIRGPAFSGEEDAYERFTNALTITDTMERVETLVRLIRHLTPETLPGAIRAYEEDLRDIYTNDLRLLMWYWAQQDPRGMLERLKDWPENRVMRMAAGEAVAWVLRKEGYDAGHALFEQLPTALREPAVPYLVLAYLESDSTPDLVALIEEFDTREERDQVAGIVVSRMLYLNRADDLLRWVESLPVGPGTKNDLKPVAFRAAITQLMGREELAYIEAWLDRIGDQPWAAGGRRAIAVNLARRKPLEAIAWSKALTPEEGRDAILGEVVRNFAKADRVRALEWMRAQPHEPVLDSGAGRLALEYAMRNPEIALEMILRIQDPKLLASVRKPVAFNWKDLPEQRRIALLSKVDEHRKTLPPTSSEGPSAEDPSASKPSAKNP